MVIEKEISSKIIDFEEIFHDPFIETIFAVEIFLECRRIAKEIELQEEKVFALLKTEDNQKKIEYEQIQIFRKNMQIQKNIESIFRLLKISNYLSYCPGPEIINAIDKLLIFIEENKENKIALYYKKTLNNYRHIMSIDIDIDDE